MEGRNGVGVDVVRKRSEKRMWEGRNAMEGWEVMGWE